MVTRIVMVCLTLDCLFCCPVNKRSCVYIIIANELWQALDLIRCVEQNSFYMCTSPTNPKKTNGLCTSVCNTLDKLASMWILLYEGGAGNLTSGPLANSLYLEGFTL